MYSDGGAHGSCDKTRTYNEIRVLSKLNVWTLPGMTLASRLGPAEMSMNVTGKILSKWQALCIRNDLIASSSILSVP